jgi:multicomponent Na+:H+ antiporter subunit A
MSGAGGADTLSDLIHQGDRLRDHGWYPAILALVALGAFTKSAQTPFHFWLPNAMEAPTPVSAFLHSSTMVKAGVYLLARLQPALGGTQAWFLLLTSVGLATLLTGAAMALRQTVLKKLLAYSTISALGLLVMLTGLIGAAPAPAAGALAQAFAVFLLAHALYKAALFLVAGSLTHETGHKTVTGLAGLRRAMPWTAATALAAGLSMAGLPPLLGFVAKEAVLAAGLDWSSSVGIVAAVAVAAAGSGFVVVALLIAWTPFAGRRPEALTAHEAPPAMLLGPAILAALSLAAGLWPALIAEPVAFPAAEALTGHLDHHGHLALWHGFNAPLLLSVLSMAAGWLFWRTRRRWQPAYSALLDLLHRVGPEAGYTAALSGLLGFARLQTRMLQSGLLRFYLMFVVGFMALLSTAALARSLPVVWTWYPDPVRWPEFTLRNLPDLLFCLVILGGTAGTVHARSRLSAIAGLGSVGYGVGLLYVRFGAPDLAITQILVETLTLILFVLVFYHLRATPHLSKWSSRLRDSIIAAAGGAVMTAFVLATYRLQSFPSISPWFTEHAVPDGKGHNVVNVILVDFRSLDTLGEITVLGVGALGVYALLKLRPSPRPCKDIRL